MIYFERLRRAIKVDRELLSKEAADLVESQIDKELILGHCPGEYFPGAPEPDDDSCLLQGPCAGCWNQEAKQECDCSV